MSSQAGPVICLCDNDIIYKLASCDLLDDTLKALNLTRHDVYVLPTAKYKFGITKRKISKRKQLYPPDVVTRLREFFTNVQELEVPGAAEDLQILSGIDGIDSGEAILFAASSRYERYLLATGDKNSLRALATTAVCRPIALKIRGHVICFEEIICRVIRHFGFSYVKEKVLSSIGCDNALCVAFGSGRDSVEANVLAALTSYVDELRSLPVDFVVTSEAD